MANEYLTKSSSFRKEIRFIHEWTIHDFDCPNVDEGVTLPSTEFEFELKNGMRFKGTLSIRGDICDARKCRLFLDCTNRSNWKVKCYFSCDESLIIERVSDPSHAQNYFHLSTGSLQYHNFYGFIGEKCSFKPSNSHTIKIEVLHVHYTQELQPSLPAVKNSKTEISHALIELFKSREFWDVTFEVGGQELHGHKGILATQSKVFAAMFKHGMKEAQSNRVVIDDIEFDVFQEIIRFMYTGEVENIDEMALKLFSASDKYDLENLKNFCGKVLAEKISADNAAEILILADLHTAKELKKVSINFINYNKEAVADTEGWKKILKNYAHLLADLYINK